VKVAVASKSRHWQFFGALRTALAAQGIEIVSTWIDWDRNHDGVEPSMNEWREHAKACIDDAVRADILLLYCADDERQFGTLLECGAALGADRQVFVVSPFDWPFLKQHPRVRCFATIEAAIGAVMAAAAGERARNRGGGNSSRTVCYHFATEPGSTG
jgi:hypothetical protein